MGCNCQYKCQQNQIFLQALFDFLVRERVILFPASHCLNSHLSSCLALQIFLIQPLITPWVLFVDFFQLLSQHNLTCMLYFLKICLRALLDFLVMESFHSSALILCFNNLLNSLKLLKNFHLFLFTLQVYIVVFFMFLWEHNQKCKHCLLKTFLQVTQYFWEVELFKLSTHFLYLHSLLNSLNFLENHPQFLVNLMALSVFVFMLYQK